MNKDVLIVPKGIRYISEWEQCGGYTLANFQFPHILDKKIPGCGFTEYGLRNNLNIVLCSPRKILLENKEMQHPNDVFYFRNEQEIELNVDADLTSSVPSSSFSDSNVASKAITNDDNLEGGISKPTNIIEEHYDYNIVQCRLVELREYMRRRADERKPYKIIVTYDSFRHVKEFLISEGLFDTFFVIVDEFQSLFVDSRFKSTQEIEFLYQLGGVQKVCFVSATPMLDEYLDQLDEFKNLPYFEFDWVSEDSLRTIRPELKVYSTNSVVYSAGQIIKQFLKGKRESLPAVVNNELVEVISNEIVFYVNSVNNIISIIKRNELQPEMCNILCANTPENNKRIFKKLGKGFGIGRVPLKGEQHKTFTFCTRTVYLGADFYSTNARTVILSDANIDSLAVDITLDLPQILGRQRLVENPWKNRAELYFKLISKGNRQTQEDFNKEIQQKIESSNSLLNIYHDTSDPKGKHELAKLFRDMNNSLKYKTNYIAVNQHSGSDLLPVFNNMVMIAEKRAFDIQQIDYKDRFTVFNAVSTNNDIITFSNQIVSHLDHFNSLNGFTDRMRYLCEANISDEARFAILQQVPAQFKKYYDAVGPERLKALGYNITRVSKEYSNRFLDTDELLDRIYSTFEVGSRYTKDEIKQKLVDIYSETGYNKTPTAKSIMEYFVVEEKLLTLPGKKRAAGFLIVSKK